MSSQWLISTTFSAGGLPPPRPPARGAAAPLTPRPYVFPMGDKHHRFGWGAAAPQTPRHGFCRPPDPPHKLEKSCKFMLFCMVVYVILSDF